MNTFLFFDFFLSMLSNTINYNMHENGYVPTYFFFYLFLKAVLIANILQSSLLFFLFKQITCQVYFFTISSPHPHYILLHLTREWKSRQQLLCQAPRSHYEKVFSKAVRQPYCWQNELQAAVEVSGVGQGMLKHGIFSHLCSALSVFFPDTEINLFSFSPYFPPCWHIIVIDVSEQK